MAGSLLACVLARENPSPHSHLQITEVLPRSNLTGHYTQLSWIEVTNFGRKIWNLTNAAVRFNDADPSLFRVYSHILLDSYESAVLHSGLDDIQASDAIRQAWGLPDTVLVVGTREYTLNSSNGYISHRNSRIAVLDSAGALVSNVTWVEDVPRGSSLQFDMHGNPTGLSRINIQGAWRTPALPSPDLGSPGLFIAAAADVMPGAAGSYPHEAMAYGRHSIFAARSDDTYGVELHRSDALNAPERIADTWRFNSSSSPQWLTEYNRALYFSAETPVHGRELWVYQSMDTKYFSPFEPELVGDLLPGRMSSDPRFLTVFNGTLFFTAVGVSGRRELHFFDDDAVNTQGPVNLDKSDNFVVPGGPAVSEPEHLFVFQTPRDNKFGSIGGRLLFTAHTAALGREIYFLAPGSTEAQLLVDLCPGPCGSDASEWFIHDDTVYFAADDGVHGREIWTYRGGFESSGASVLSSGLVTLLQDVEAGPVGSHPVDFAVWSGQIVFIASTAAAGREIYILDVDGIAQLLTEVLVGSASSEFESLTLYSGKLFATGVDSLGRRELYVWDGHSRIRPVFFRPPQGTAVTGSILDGAQLWLVLDELLWVADDGLTGQEIHKLYSRPEEDLSSCSTEMQEMHFMSDPINVAAMQLASQASCAVKLTLSNCAGCRLGERVAMDNDDTGGHFIVASAGNGVDGTGAVHVWARQPKAGRVGRSVPYSWEHMQALDILQALPTADASAQCGYSIALEHGRILVGCPGYGSDDGLVLLFQLTRRMTWEHTWTFHSQQSGSRFGSSVDLDDKWVVVGSPDSTIDSLSVAGSAHVYQFQSNAWSLFTALQAHPPLTSAEFGRGVAVRGENIVVGAPGSNLDSGSVHIYIFETLFQRWAPPTVPVFRAPDGSLGSRFGESVALSSNHLAVSAAKDSSAGSETGAAWVFYYSGLLTFYVPQDKLVPHDVIPWDRVSQGGIAVTSEPPQVLMSGAIADAAVAGSGAYTFALQNRYNHWWQQAAKIRPQDTDSSDEFGAAVAISHAVGVVSAPGDDSAGVDAGALYFIVPSNASLQFATLPWDMLYDDHGDSFLGATFLCPAGHFEADLVVVGTSGSCAVCSSGACPAGQYEEAQCSAKHDRSCTSCTAPCAAGTVETRECATQHDRRCSAVGSAEATAFLSGGKEPCRALGLCEELPAAPAAEQPRGTPTLQRFALTLLHGSLMGEMWSKSWDVSPFSDPCLHKWHGVLCDGDMNIIGLTLRRVAARGSLPESFGEHLQFMRSVDLSDNDITGALPESISQMTLLRELLLSGNHFSGGLPLWLNAMTHLYRLDLTQIRSFREPTDLPSRPFDPLRNASTLVHIDELPGQNHI